MIAVIPAAGRGTRMGQLTQGRAKELLELGRKPVIQRVIEEAKTVTDRVIVVTSREKPDLLEFLESQPVEIVFQSEMRGFAHAIGCAEVEGDMMVMLGDCALCGDSPVTRLNDLLEKGIDGAIAVEQVEDHRVGQYGIPAISDFGGITKIVEKPKLEEAPSRFAIAARYAFSGPLTAFVNAAAWSWKEPGELGLTTVLNAAIQVGFDIKAVPLPKDTRRADVGTPAEYQEARFWNW